MQLFGVSDSQAILRYSFRLRPGKTAEDRLLLEWNCARYVWNLCVEAGNESRKLFKEGVAHEAPTFYGMSKKLTALRAEHEWLREGSAVVQQQTIRRWHAANQQAFKQPGVGFPGFRSSKRTYPSLEYAGNAFKIENDRLCVPRGISIPVVWSRKLPSKPTSCVVTQDGTGDWSVSFVVRRDGEVFPPSEEAIGIDWGVATVATTTDPNFNLSCGNQTANNAQALKRANRKLARAQHGSNHRKKAKRRLAKLHLRIARQRKDRAFKWARKVVTAFGRIAIEDFKTTFLTKTTMAKKAHDGAVGMTKKILIGMAEAAGRTVALVEPAYSTRTCSECGSINKHRLTLSMRTFVCETCGSTRSRDENAARVIRARAGFTPANVEDVRLGHDSGLCSSCLS